MKKADLIKELKSIVEELEKSTEAMATVGTIFTVAKGFEAMLEVVTLTAKKVGKEMMD